MVKWRLSLSEFQWVTERLVFLKFVLGLDADFDYKETNSSLFEALTETLLTAQKYNKPTLESTFNGKSNDFVKNLECHFQKVMKLKGL